MNMVDHFVLPANFRCQIDLHDRTSFHIIHGGIKSWPDFQIPDLLGLLGIEAISAHLLKLHEPHHLFKEDGIESELLGVILIDDFGI